MKDVSRASDRTGLEGALYAAAACLLWGLLPVYWKALRPTPAPEILAHRVFWASLCVAALTAYRRGWSAIGHALRQRQAWLITVASAVVLTANWLLYVWAVNAGHVLQASLGYFINPLFSVALGVVFLHEQLQRAQRAAIGLAALGVGILAVFYGEVPWIALGLASTFATYSLLRKVSPLNSLQGLTVETLLLAPAGALYLGYVQINGTGSFSTETPSRSALLAACGVITAVPLLLYATAARHLRLSTLGLFLYLNPTCQMLLAVWVYDESMAPTQWVGFAFIWAGLAVASLNPWRKSSAIASRARGTQVK